MNLVWIAILAIVSGGPGPAADPRPVAPVVPGASASTAAGSGPSISPSEGHVPRPAPAPVGSFAEDLRDLDENEPGGVLDLDGSGPALTAIHDWARTGPSWVAAPTLDRHETRPAALPMRC